MDSRTFELLDDREQMTDGAGQPIKAHDDQRFAGADVTQQSGQHWAATVGPGGIFLQHRLTARRVKFIALRIGTLVLGRDPGIADKPSRWANSACFYHSPCSMTVSPAIYK